MLKIRKIYKITKQVEDYKLARRLCELGFYIGNKIELVHISLFKKSYMFICKNVTLSLTKNIVESLGLVDE